MITNRPACRAHVTHKAETLKTSVGVLCFSSSFEFPALFFFGLGRLCPSGEERRRPLSAEDVEAVEALEGDDVTDVVSWSILLPEMKSSSIWSMHCRRWS